MHQHGSTAARQRRIDACRSVGTLDPATLSHSLPQEMNSSSAGWKRYPRRNGVPLLNYHARSLRRAIGYSTTAPVLAASVTSPSDRSVGRLIRRGSGYAPRSLAGPSKAVAHSEIPTHRPLSTRDARGYSQRSPRLHHRTEVRTGPLHENVEEGQSLISSDGPRQRRAPDRSRAQQA